MIEYLEQFKPKFLNEVESYKKKISEFIFCFSVFSLDKMTAVIFVFDSSISFNCLNGNKDKAKEFCTKVKELANIYNLPFFVVTDGASATSNNGCSAVKNARETSSVVSFSGLYGIYTVASRTNVIFFT